MSRSGYSLSVGLGGNISKSLSDVGQLARRGEPIPPRFASASEDAGNGSLMRLGAVPVRYHLDAERARVMARESSLATHPGQLAADACDFATYVIVRAIRRGTEEPTGARAWLDTVCADYLERMDCGKVAARTELRRLLRAEEPEDSAERCWNWRGERLELEWTVKRRGASYNGFPVSAGYFGSFSLDGLAMALHAFYTTDTADAAVVKVVNMAGDADTTGAICGQIVGAFYGAGALNPAWVEDVRRWDRRDIELRAIALYAEAVRDARAAVAGGGVGSGEVPAVLADAQHRTDARPGSASLRPPERGVVGAGGAASGGARRVLRGA
jgi:ADP-ribosylglycohydrolase